MIDTLLLYTNPHRREWRMGKESSDDHVLFSYILMLLSYYFHVHLSSP